MNLTFRDLVADDIGQCVDVIKEIYPQETSKEYHETLPKDLSEVLNKNYPSRCIVALIDNKIIGLGCYVKINTEPSVQNVFYKLTWINIIPKEQGRGIGRMLVGELEKHISQECRKNLSVILETDKPEFYRKLGYNTYVKNGNNDVMQKLFAGISTPRVLIGTLFSEVKDYCIKEWFKNVCSINYPSFDLCMIDNSDNDKYHKKIFKYLSEHKSKSNIGKFTIIHVPRIHKKSEVFMADSANRLRNHFLQNNYDWLFNLESDIFPESDIIDRLMSYNKPVIGATYFSGRKDSSYPMIIELDKYNDLEAPTNIPYIKGFYEMTDAFEPKISFGQGLGCVLIHREIVKRIPFRKDDTHAAHYDTIFYCDLFDNNIANYLVSIICRHENQTWDKQLRMIEKIK